MQKNNYGRDVELQICRYIENEGMKILARNYTVKGGETDIIAIDGEYICFIEIKFRKLEAVEISRSVGIKKQRRIIKSAEKYLRETDCELPAMSTHKCLGQASHIRITIFCDLPLNLIVSGI